MQDEIKQQQEYVDCNLCGSADHNLFLKVPERISGEEFSVVRCSNCGLFFLNPRPTQQAISSYYPQEYDYKPGSNREVRLKKKLSKRINDRIKEIIREKYYNYPAAHRQRGKLLETVKAIVVFPFYLRLRLVGRDIKIIPYRGEGRLLEIGCGNGRFLAAQRKLGWQVYGVDQSRHAAEIARKDFGLDVYCGQPEEAKFKDGFFEVVYLEHAFEHVPNPAGLLKEIHRILSQEGLLIIKVPNVSTFQRFIFKKYWPVWDAPRHFYFFGPQMLKKFSTQAGFKMTNIKYDFGNGILRGALRALFQDKYKIDSIDNKIPRFIFRALAYLFAYLHSSDTVTVYFKKKHKR